ncbi:MAG: hypothetical protein OEQ28_00830 [Acidobacteriota bacterium]|nr:hypothetical protein [Acidobacteriota bacterium]
MSRLVSVLLALICVLVAGNCSKDLKAQERSDYAGQQSREIKTLSESDIEQLQKGEGWGLAKAAELNGFPGPAHVIELKEKMDLSDQQLTRLKRIYEEMRKEAIPLGVKLIDLEKELNVEFSNKRITEKGLKRRLDSISVVTANLRFVHLAAHLKTSRILSVEQISRYNELRGYGSNDPCESVPDGHNPELWKKHNNCS